MSDDERGYESDGASEDVAQVVELLHRVRLENSELKRNFESLKGLHIQLSSAHQRLQSDYAALYDERVSVERQYQGLCDAWRAELDDKQRSLEAARAQLLSPQELDLLKVKLLDEIEGPYKLKCDKLEKEAHSCHEQLVALRRDHEELQAAYKGLELRAASESELQQADHVALVTQLRDRLAELGNPTAKLTAAETQLRALEREKEALSFSLAKLQDELADVRRQKERAVVEKEAVSFKVERKVKDIQAEEVMLNGLVESLTRKNRHLQKELSDALRSNEEQFGQLMKAQAERAGALEQLEQLKKAAAAEKLAMAQQHEDTVHRLEEKLDTVRKELYDRERQVAELHISHQEQVSRLVEAHDVRLSELESESAERARQAREQRNELQAKLDALQDLSEEYRAECEELKRKDAAKTAATQRDMERLQATLSEAEKASQIKTQELAAAKRDLETMRVTVNTLEVQGSHLTQGKQDLEAQVIRLQEEAQAAEARYQALNKELDESRRALESEKVAALNHMEAARKLTATEKSALAKKYQASLQDVVARHEGEMKRLRKKLKTAYKEIATLTDEVTDLRFRSHDLQGLVDAAGYVTGSTAAFSSTVGAAGVMAPLYQTVGLKKGMPQGAGSAGGYGLLSELQNTTGSSRGGMGGSGRIGVGVCDDVGLDGSGALSAGVLADMAALRERQGQYLAVVAGQVKA